MGIFEDPRFAEGTFSVARAVWKHSQWSKEHHRRWDSVKALNRRGLVTKLHL